MRAGPDGPAFFDRMTGMLFIYGEAMPSLEVCMLMNSWVTRWRWRPGIEHDDQDNINDHGISFNAESNVPKAKSRKRFDSYHQTQKKRINADKISFAMSKNC